MTSLLSGASWEVVGEASDISEAERLAQAIQPNLALVDVMLPGINGIEGIPLLKKAATKMHVIFVSAYHDQLKLFQDSARRLGAEAFISKDELDLAMLEKLSTTLKIR